MSLFTSCRENSIRELSTNKKIRYVNGEVGVESKRQCVMQLKNQHINQMVININIGRIVLALKWPMVSELLLSSFY